MNTLIEKLSNDFPDKTDFSANEIKSAATELGMDPSKTLRSVRKANKKVSRGVYQMITPKQTVENIGVASVKNSEIFVPDVDPTFVQWGNSTDINKIIKSGMFYPTFITGLSGNGKTFMVEQACAKAGREYIRVQISPETDEDDLIGGFRLINGETVFQKGPVIKAMEAGAILLIDEIDRGTNKIMCLQGILEGKPVLIKKTGEVVKPASGFNVLATANTKGKGSDDGRFSAATILDEAFLERFTITLEQAFPSMNTEKKIIQKHMEKFEKIDENFKDKLVVWADTIRKTYEDEGIDEVISTRRLCHIVQTFSIFDKKDKAIELCISRFDTDTKEAFLDLYTKVDATMDGKDIGDSVSTYTSEESTDTYNTPF